MTKFLNRFLLLIAQTTTMDALSNQTKEDQPTTSVPALKVKTEPVERNNLNDQDQEELADIRNPRIVSLFPYVFLYTNFPWSVLL